MRALRENFIPVAFLALWMGASAYTISALGGMRASSRPIEASMDVTVTAPAPATAHASCVEEAAKLAAGT
jgi:hypothetical protein